MTATLLINRLAEAEDTFATIKRPRTTTRVSGIAIPTYANHLLNVPVNIQDKTGSESERYGMENARRVQIIYAPHGSDIQERDRVIVKDRTFDVQNAHDRGFGALAYRSLECTETEGTP